MTSHCHPLRSWPHRGLTPSEGQPSSIAWLVYAILPLGLTLLGSLVVRPWIVRVFLLIEAGGILAMKIHPLRLFHVFWTEDSKS